jgi:hypothetical protein
MGIITLAGLHEPKVGGVGITNNGHLEDFSLEFGPSASECAKFGSLAPNHILEMLGAFDVKREVGNAIGVTAVGSVGLIILDEGSQATIRIATIVGDQGRLDVLVGRT